MSSQGKKIAQVKMALRIAKLTTDAAIRSTKLHPLVAIVHQEHAKTEAIRLAEAVRRTPHQHFNAKGEIDKRKVKRHNRKIGMYDRNDYVIKINRA